MKKRDIIIDLTAFLDVILIMMFLALMQTSGDAYAYRAQLEEMTVQHAEIVRDLQATEDALSYTMYRLHALADWDNERYELMEDTARLNEWRAAVEGVIFFISARLEYIETNRVLALEAYPRHVHRAEIIWAEGLQNYIVNEAQLAEFFTETMHGLIGANTDENPVLVMINSHRMRLREFNFIIAQLNQFIRNAEYDFNVYFSTYVME
ncbi:MAG: hypothetical protein FWC16_02230 [Defluviitaleaceae bacterium]|nr:hypothetical protein [Defluviitaleaceae bacterium]MCL2273717.1 hypothetical protein [Defluviitaleaceae bacterium]